MPVVGTDDHLPPVAPDRLTAASLRRRFAEPPEWQLEFPGDGGLFAGREPASASVLVPIVDRADGLRVLLTRRTEHLKDHAGQISFPGGRQEEHDADVVAAALREAHEEVGLERRYTEVLGSLPLYRTGSAFIITPVVALVDPGHTLRPNPYEVADVFEVPLSFLLDPAHHRRHAVVWEGVRREWFSMPWDDGAKTHFIWGATAGMLRNFYRFMSAR